MSRVNNYFGILSNKKDSAVAAVVVLLMDDLKIFSGTLQPEEVRNDLNKAKLINYWPMSNLSDVIGGADLFNGTNYEFTNDRFTNPNSSILFNNGYLAIPPNVYFNGDFSITLWIKLKSSQYTKILNFGNFGDAGESDNIQLLLSSNKDVYGLIYQGIYSSYISPNSKLKLNEWFHIGFVLKKNTSFIYINGKLETQGIIDYVPINISRSNNYIGKSNQVSDSNINAVYNDLKIYKGPLQEADILDEFNSKHTENNIIWGLNGMGNECRFENNDLFNFETVELVECSRICSNIERCTHFTYNNGKCFLKDGVISKKDAIINKGFQCGIVDHIKTFGKSAYIDCLTQIDQVGFSYEIPLDTVELCSSICRANSKDYAAIQNKYTCYCFQEYALKNTFSGCQSQSPCSENECTGAFYKVYLTYKAELQNYWPMSNFTDVKTGSELIIGNKDLTDSFRDDHNSIPNSAINFEYSFVTVPRSNYFSGDFTVTLWAQFLEYNNYAFISSNNYNGDRILFSIYNENLYFYIYKQESYIYIRTYTQPIELKRWFHLGFTLENGKGIIYVNGQLIASGDLRVLKEIKSSYIFFGNYDSNSNLDDIKLFKGALKNFEMIKDFKL